MNIRRVFWRFFQRERELDDEIEFHLRMAAREHMERGDGEREARNSARREFGSVTFAREITREMWGFASLERLRQDLRYAVRLLVRNPMFALTSILSLALGIGANTAMFGISEAILLRPLAIPEPQDVMLIKTQTPTAGFEDLAFAELEELRKREELFECVAGGHHRGVAFALGQDATPRWRLGMAVTADFFSMMGAPLARGRAFLAEEVKPTAPAPVVILSHRLWRTQFGASDSAIGTTVRINGTAHTVIGVVSPEFTGVDTLMHPEFYVPVHVEEPEDRRIRNLRVFVRVKPGVKEERIEAELAVMAKSLESEFPATNRNRLITVQTQLENRINQSRAVAAVVVMLMGLALLVLAVASANVAGLLLARGRVRMREMAVRASIGAGRLRLVRQMLTESLMLALLGALGGIAVGYSVIQFVSAIQVPTDTPIGIDARLDSRVFLFSLGVSCFSAFCFGLAPALQASRPGTVHALKGGAAPRRNRRRPWGRNALVAAQVACTLVLLVASAAFLDGFRKMLVVDPGLRTSGLMMIEFDPPTAGYSAQQTRQFYRRLLDTVRADGDVVSAALSRCVPFRPNFTDEPVFLAGSEPEPGKDSVMVSANPVDEAYFQTVGIPLMRGRPFVPTDDSSSKPVAIINEEFAERYFAGESGIGRTFRYGESRTQVEVVGVARNVKYLSLAELPQPYFYLPYLQSPRSRMTLFVHTRSDPRLTGDRLVRLVQSLDPSQPVFNTRPFQEFYEMGALGPSRVALQMITATGIVGLLLALVGIYGLVTYNVSRQTREIGIRLAVGARRGQVVGQVIGQGLVVALWGCALGGVAAYFTFRGLAAALSGLGALNPLVALVVPVLLVLLTVLASLPAALRAAWIDPVRALRTE